MDQTNEKLKVDIYVPLDACACEWDKFINRVFETLTPYLNFIDYNTKNLNSEEAYNLNLHGKCVVIEGKKVISASYLLKNEITNILKEKGLI
ncbi:MAG: hypothetical protein EU531_10885 [Promethearchaeota archaeon]|nr:MAG: hypothetical protein EU531_10885 [Candidatus Lokiarchaeota archaeon]